MDPPPHINLDAALDAHPPGEIARRVETAGIAKSRLDTLSTLALGILGGAFIALGADFSAVVSLGADMSLGPSRLLAGAAFALGLVLVIGAGAELFTGNNLIVMAWASGRIRGRELWRNWVLVYLGNAAGATATAVVLNASGHFRMGDGALGGALWRTAWRKAQLDPGEAFLLGVLCNALVCLAVWLAMGARGMADKILAVFLPVTAFVACGFEHSIANWFYFPAGLLAGAPAGTGAAATADPVGLSISGIIVRNLLPVTLGNSVGGGVLVAGVYWLAYLRPARRQKSPVEQRRDMRAMPTILLVDDDKLFRWAVKERLEAAGCRVLEAGSVEAARFLVPSAQLDAALLDYHLPDGTGVDLTGAVRGFWPNCLIVVVTAHPTDLCANEARVCGADHYVGKLGFLDGSWERILEPLIPGGGERVRPPADQGPLPCRPPADTPG